MGKAVRTDVNSIVVLRYGEHQSSGTGTLPFFDDCSSAAARSRRQPG